MSVTCNSCKNWKRLHKIPNINVEVGRCSVNDAYSRSDCYACESYTALHVTLKKKITKSKPN